MKKINLGVPELLINGICFPLEILVVNFLASLLVIASNSKSFATFSFPIPEIYIFEKF